MYILNEDFSSATGTTPPVDWLNIIVNGSPQDEWHFDNPGAQSIAYPITEPFAIFDAAYYSDNQQTEEVALETAYFDASVSNYVILEFDHKYISGLGSICKIQAKEGNLWIDLVVFNSDILNVKHEVVDLSAVIGGVTNAKLRFLWKGNGSGFWAFDNISIYGALPLDAGISEIDNPVPPIGSGNQIVKVRLKNYGYYDLNTAEINWSVNGESQTPFLWNGNLAYGESKGDIAIGNYNFQGASVLKVWSESPNNQEDSNPYNDTTTVNLISSLCGEYTIGGINPDFENFVVANTVLHQAGVSCPVIFYVRDGSYTEQFEMNDIPGSSDINTITFVSENADSNLVYLQYNGMQNPVVSLNGAKHIRFRRITITGGNSVFVDNYSEDIIFEGCRLIADNEAVTIRSGSNNIIVRNNVITAENGISMKSTDGNVMAKPENIHIVENKFTTEYSATSLDDVRNVLIKDNLVSGKRMAFYGVSCKNIIVEQNKTDIISQSNWTNSVIEYSNSDSVDIINNYCASSGEYKTYGISLKICTNFNVYFNNINVTNTDIGEESQGIRLVGSNHINLKNNISHIENKGIPIFINENVDNLISDYNDFYSNDGHIGQIEDDIFTDLPSWQNAIGGDINSYNENPFYSSSTVLKPNQVLINNKGISITGISRDIDDVIRDNPAGPDIGAKEFDLCNPDAGINYILEPQNPVPNGVHDIKVRLQNHGTEALNSVTIKWQVNEDMQTPYQWTGSLESSDHEDLIIGSYDFSGGAYKLEVWTSNPNGQNDCRPVNDTTILELASSLCGIYTIGGIDPDFEDFTSAANVLNLAGVSCPVTFMVRNGQYNEQLFLKHIPGTSTINTVTFVSEKNDSSLVNIIYNEYPAPAILLKNTKHLRFYKLGFEGYNAAFVDVHSSSVRFESCKLVFDDNGIVISSGSNNVEIRNNNFSGGKHSIKTSLTDGIYVDEPYDISVVDNTMSQTYSAAFIEGTNNVVFNANNIHNSRTGLYFEESKNIIVRNNRMDITSEYGWYNSAVLLRQCDSSNIYNNYLSTKGDYMSSGIFSNESSNNNIYFNSINITNIDLARGSCGIKLSSSNNDVIKNNIIKIKDAGIPLFIDELSQNYSLDYNDYYSPYNLIAQLGESIYNDMENWQNDINGDNNSLQENPFYVSDTDLEMNQILLNNKAKPVFGISGDIDGTVRNPTQPDMGAKEYEPCHPDAGVNSVAMPQNPLTEGVQPVVVMLQNQGSGTLNSAIINWEVNGETQPSFNWSGALSSSETKEITIGNYDFQTGLYQLKIWTTKPNQQIDCNPYNDTIIEKRAVALCGEYTIGGVDADFESFGEASEVLNMAGLSCAVIFKVRDGIYNEKFAFNAIPGSSQTNTITFESESGDSTAVIIKYDNYEYNIIGFNNAAHIRFRQINVLGNYCFFIDDNSNDIKIESCILSCSEYGIAIRNGSNDIDINNNNIYGANYGVFISPDDGNDALAPNNIRVTNNNIVGTYSAVYSEYSNNITLSGNTVNNLRSGFYIANCESIDINSNSVNVESESNWYNASVYLVNSSKIRLVNNFLSSDGNYRSDGVYTYQCSDLKIYFNSFDIRNTDAGHDSRAMAFSNSDDIIFKNNILNIKYNGLPIYIDNISSDYILDYNNYFNPGLVIGLLGNEVYHSLTEWGIAVNGDANSKNVNPYFVSNTNPLPFQRELNGAGIPVAGILLDRNGLIRNDQAPDVGCIEFTVDFGITDLLNPSLDCFHAGSENVTIYLRQFGDIPFIDLKLAYQVNGGEVHTDMVPGTIYNDLVFTFNADINISTEGEYVFKIWLINTLDDNVNNDTLTVTRYSKPAPEVSAFYENKCSWKEVTFSGSASVSDPYFIDGYEWLFGDGVVSNQQNPIHIYDSVGNYDAIFRAYSNAGCYTADTLDVFIDPDYEPLAIDFDLHKEICEGDGDGYLIISGTGGTPPYSYYHNNAELQNTQIDNVSTGDYIFSIKDSEQCEFSDTVFVSPAVYLNPIIIPQPDSGFAPLEVYFDLLSNEVDSFLWQFDNGSSSTLENPYFLYEEYGEHIVTVNVNSGEPYYCEEYDTAIIFVDVNVSIIAPNVFTPNGDGINDYFVIETNGIEDMTTNILDRQGIRLAELIGVENAWDGKTKSGKAAPDGVYYYFIYAVGFNKANYHKEGSVILLKAYATANPNPARNVLNVETYGLNDGNLIYEIYDVNSNLVRSIKADNQKIMSIDISSLEDGIYIIKICDNSNCISKKFIKSNY